MIPALFTLPQKHNESSCFNDVNAVCVWNQTLTHNESLSRVHFAHKSLQEQINKANGSSAEKQGVWLINYD